MHGEIDWDRRYALMRHHTALHAMSGVIFQLYGATVTGGQMYPDRARMDFLLPDLSAERLQRIEERTNELLAEGHPVSVRFLPRDEALQIPDLIRTRVSLIPEAIPEISRGEYRGHRSAGRRRHARGQYARGRPRAHCRLGKQR